MPKIRKRKAEKPAFTALNQHKMPPAQKIFRLLLAQSNHKPYLCTTKKNRGVEQLVARWAHNPKVVCSSQASATLPKKQDASEGI